MDAGQVLALLGGGGGTTAVVVTAILAVLNRRARDKMASADKLYERLERAIVASEHRAVIAERQAMRAIAQLAQRGIEFDYDNHDEPASRHRTP